MSQTILSGRKAPTSLVNFFKSTLGQAICALALLLLVGIIAAPSSLSLDSLLSMLPFAAILGVAGTGQFLVVQQRGLDLSVAGVISLAAVFVTLFPGESASGWSVLRFVIAALAMGAVVGSVNGLLVTFVHLPPLVATIGVNALLIGATLLTTGGVPSTAPAVLSQLAINKTLGIPNILFVVLLTTLAAHIFLRNTAAGRRFVAVAANADAAYALGMKVARIRIGTYAAAGVLYALAGVLLAGFLSTPGLFLGNDYILWTVAAVVVGANSIAGGGQGSVVATVIGAFFLTYLGQVILALGFDQSVQQITEAAIIILGVAITGFFAPSRS
jgi:ribose/xylose/arabinose/galactoside ABC-type transport system permease subunit